MKQDISGKRFPQRFLIYAAFLLFLTNYSKNRFSAPIYFLFYGHDRFLPSGRWDSVGTR
ncbi:hypothetical protein EMIT0P44_30159 [Pseudomonas sp. IT-P44]